MDPGFMEYLGKNAQAMRYIKLSAGKLAFRSGIALMPHGDAAFEQLYNSLVAAQDEIFIVTWYLEPDMELKRDGWDAPVASRKQYRLDQVLLDRARAGVVVRILVWDFLNLRRGVLDRVVGLSLPGALVMKQVEELRRKLRAISPKSDIVIAQHPTPFATHSVLGISCELGGAHHQKIWIVRSKDVLAGFVGGMNLRQHDWDTGAHEVLDPRRNPADMDGDARKRRFGARQDPEYPPRHDWMVRLDGPAAYRLWEEFSLRWGMAKKGRLALPPLSTIAAPANGFAQITHTLPVAFGGGSRDVLDVYAHAIGQAQRYIYIENQYWTAEAISGAVADRLKKVNDLEVVIVLPDKAEDPVIGDYIAGEQWYQLMRLWNVSGTSRVRAYTLYRKHAVQKEYVNVYVHAKVAIIDDLWASIGSANTNNRSMLLDTECTAQLANGPTVTKMRKDAWREMLGGSIGERDDAVQAIRQGWHPIGDANAQAMKRFEPLTGLIAPLPQPKSPKRLPEALRGFI